MPSAKPSRPLSPSSASRSFGISSDWPLCSAKRASAGRCTRASRRAGTPIARDTSRKHLMLGAARHEGLWRSPGASRRDQLTRESR
eukprot:scaffold1311_cov256-Pinguiococcus_pyrenoidosus.AAC.54